MVYSISCFFVSSASSGLHSSVKSSRLWLQLPLALSISENHKIFQRLQSISACISLRNREWLSILKIIPAVLHLRHSNPWELLDKHRVRSARAGRDSPAGNACVARHYPFGHAVTRILENNILSQLRVWQWVTRELGAGVSQVQHQVCIGRDSKDSQAAGARLPWVRECFAR
jgi:hypothetical protein